MYLKLRRRWLTSQSTIGELTNGVGFICFVLEDTVRPVKIKGKTAIPAGKYEIVITMSKRFGVLMPLLLNVPNFSGIRIHPGNRPAHTEGCLLPGLRRAQDQIFDSKKAYDKLYAMIDADIKAGNRVFIEIIDHVPSVAPKTT